MRSSWRALFLSRLCLFLHLGVCSSSLYDLQIVIALEEVAVVEILCLFGSSQLLDGKIYGNGHACNGNDGTNDFQDSF